MTRPNAHPPAPGPKGGLRNVWQRLTDHVGLMDRLHRDYGTVVRFELPPLHCCAVFDADLAREIYADEDMYPRMVPPEVFGVLNGPLLLDEDHERWRGLILSGLAGERAERFQEMIANHAIALRDRWRPGLELDLREEFLVYATRCILDALLGGEPPVDTRIGMNTLQAMKYEVLLTLLPSGLSPLFTKPPWPTNLRLRRELAEADACIYRSIERARDPSHPGRDIASHFVRAGEEGNGDSPWKSDEQIRDDIFILVAAFTDNPTAGLTCAVHYLDRHPAARKRLEQEVDAVLGDRPIEPGDLEKLPYTRAVFKETLRLSPPPTAHLPRVAARDSVLGGYLIPKDTLVVIGTHVIQRREAYWRHAEEFRPERWLEARREHPECPAHAFLTFGLEQRVCPFADFSEMLFVYAHASIAQRLRLAPASAEHPKRANVVVGIKGAVPATVRARPAGQQRQPMVEPR